jgi:hypothetical protein
MKNHSSQFFIMPRALMVVALSLTASLAHANAIYNAFADASLTIDSISNQTNQNDLAGLSIIGDVRLLNEGSSNFGNAQASRNGVTDLQDSGASSPGWLLHQSSDVLGYADASPQQNIAGSYHSSKGEFNLRNDSLTDSFQINFSLVYNLAIGASVTKPLDKTADAGALVGLIDDLLQINFEKDLTADALSILSLTDNPWSETQLFSITLEPGGFDRLSLNVSARGNAVSAPVPLPASAFFLGSGLVGLLGAAKRRQLSVA